MRFGDRLAQLLHQKSRTPKELAAHLGYADAGVVYRWIRNEQVPKLSASYMREIVRFLELDPSEREQIKEAQITSLAEPPGQRTKGPRRPTARQEQSAVARLLEHAGTKPHAAPGGRQSPRSTSPVRFGAAGWRSGRQEVTEAAVALVESAPPPERHDDRQILLTTQGKEGFDKLPGLQDRWHGALQSALQRGWHVCHLLRLDRNVDRSVDLVDGMLDLLGSGRYHPYYFERYGLLQPPYDLLVAPGCAAMVLFATGGQVHADVAQVLSEPQQIAALCRHFELLRVNAKPLCSGFWSQTQEVEVTRALVGAEAKPGGRQLILRGPSALTLPASWLTADSFFARLAKLAGHVSAADMPVYMSYFRQRLDAFETNVRSFDYLDICPRRALRQLVDEGRYPPDEPLNMQYMPLDLRMEHLQNVVHMLRSHERFHLALLDEDEEERVRADPTRIVASDGDVFVTGWSFDTAGRVVQVTLHITEPTMVSAFREHFFEQWERIAPRNKDKAYVVGWLEQQVALLQQRMGAEPQRP